MTLTPENIQALNHLLENSGNGAVYFCIVEVGQLWSFSPPRLEACKDYEEYENLLHYFELIEAGDPEAIRKLASIYVNVAGKLIVEEVILQDGRKVGLLKFVKNELDKI